LNLVSEASELRAWITRSVIDVQWLPLLQREAAAHLAHSSTSIEGNPLTLPEVEALARGEVAAPQARETHEVLNYLAAMRWIWGRKSGSDIRADDLLRLHRLLTQKIIPAAQCGSWKSRANRVVDARGVTLYTPPGPDQARPMTEELLSWLGGPQARDLHPILASAIAHHRLVSIHPFTDGNGRAARALAVWTLWVRGFDTQHLFALDDFYANDRPRYYQKIQQARDLDDDLSDWLEYVAEGVVWTLEQTRRRIQSLQVSSRKRKIILTKRQEDLLRYLRDKGRLGAPEIEKAFKISRVRVGQILNPLISAGLVKRHGRTRGATYELRP
jgi:Fic family protein